MEEELCWVWDACPGQLGVLPRPVGSSAGRIQPQIFFPDKCGELIWAGWVLNPEEVTLATEPTQELHIAWRSFEDTKRHSPLAIFRHQLGLHLPSRVTETYVGLPNWITFLKIFCHITGSQEVGSPVMFSRKSWSTLEQSSFLLSLWAWGFSSQSHEPAAPPTHLLFPGRKKGRDEAHMQSSPLRYLPFIKGWTAFPGMFTCILLAVPV